MSGMCGWIGYGASAADNQGTITTMAAPMARFDGGAIQAVAGSRSAVAVTAIDASAMVFQRDGALVAVWGQVTLPDARLAASQIEQRVQTALAELSDEQMRVVELSFFEEKAHAEIARILKIPLGTVKSRLRLAMNRLRALLGELS